MCLFVCFLLLCKAYASGCDVVILLSGFTRVQIIPGSLYGYKEVSCIDCCDCDGKVRVYFGQLLNIIIEPVLHVQCTISIRY